MDPQRKKVKTTIPVKLTAAEQKKCADEAAALMNQLDEKEEEYKLIQREWRSKLKQIRLDMRRFLNAYREQVEDRDVECEQVYDTNAGETWFEYGGDQFKRRAMDAYEIEQVKQGVLFDDKANLPTDKGAEDADDCGEDEPPEDFDEPPLSAIAGG